MQHKKQHDEKESAPPHALKLQRTSFNRFATFGVNNKSVPVDFLWKPTSACTYKLTSLQRVY